MSIFGGNGRILHISREGENCWVSLLCGTHQFSKYGFVILASTLVWRARLLAYPRLVLACMTLGISKTWFGVHDSWYWFGIFKGKKRFWWHFFWDDIILVGSTRRHSGSLGSRKIHSSSSPFWCHKISKFVLQVSNVSSLDIWGFLRFVLGDLFFFFFCEVFSSCDLHLRVFVRLMPFLATL